jgi:hypothetical protein
MNYVLSIIFGLMFSLNSYGQNINLVKPISLKDSILLRNFWTDFKNAVIKKDKVRLAKLCKFPFYCSPCIDYVRLKQNDQITVKVTEAIFLESQYKLFFDQLIKAELEKYKDFSRGIFNVAYADNHKPNGFSFSYTIVPPSNTWEGSQGFIYLRKINGTLKITGIDTVP